MIKRRRGCLVLQALFYPFSGGNVFAKKGLALCFFWVHFRTFASTNSPSATSHLYRYLGLPKVIVIIHVGESI